MDGLVTWLGAQLDDDERVACAAHANRWKAGAGQHDDEVVIFPDHAPSGVAVAFGDRNAQHIARWDPARVLAEVDAKRRILDEAAAYSPELEHGDNGEWAFNRVVRLLALPYAGRPGYRDEWKP